jgi:hypothetical protein
MPIHDWSRVGAGKFHHFRQSWLFRIAERLNTGVLPPAFYAAGERVEGALQRDMVRRTVDEEESIYLWKKDHLAIRTADRDRLAALLEIVSPGNKASRREMERSVRRITSALQHGYHLLVIDLCLPSDFDPHGVHGAIWDLGKPRYRISPWRTMARGGALSGTAKCGMLGFRLGRLCSLWQECLGETACHPRFLEWTLIWKPGTCSRASTAT